MHSLLARAALRPKLKRPRCVYTSHRELAVSNTGYSFVAKNCANWDKFALLTFRIHLVISGKINIPCSHALTLP